MTYNDINPCSPRGKGQKKAIKQRSEECLPGDQQSLSRLEAGILGNPRKNKGFLNRSVGNLWTSPPTLIPPCGPHRTGRTSTPLPATALEIPKPNLKSSMNLQVILPFFSLLWMLNQYPSQQ